MEHDISIVPIGYQDSTNSAYDTLPSSTPSQTRPDAPKSTTFATTSSIHRLDSKEGSNNWRFQTPKYGLTTHPNARPEPRPFVNKYFFKRPRLLQYYSDGAIVDSRGHKLAGPGTPAGEFALSTTTSGAASSFDSTPEHLVEESSDPGTSKIQRDWLNLFIDLLWVGIISNISSSFVASAFSTSPSTPTWGYAFLEFMTLFLTAFRFWSYIRKFLNNFFRKDFFQSVFLTWVLVLAMFFGNQTPYFLDDAGGKWIIATFLVAKASFVAVEALYCFYIKEIRREFLLTFLISIPVTTLWASALGVSWPARAALMLPAVLLEGVVSAIIALPLGDWFLRGAPKKALDPDNFVDRLQGFFIIVLGEGVYGLIAGNNWGVGLNSRVSYAIEALMIYSAIFWLFFTGDQTKTYIHAIYRNRYTMLAFQGFHVLLYASILLLDASVKYLIQNSDGSDVTDADMAHSLLLARWTIAASLDATLIWMTLKSLLNRGLDNPGTLLVDSRYIRMAPRAVACVIIMCLPAVNDISPSTFFGIILALLQCLILWEVVASMEKGAKWFEPKDS